MLRKLAALIAAVAVVSLSGCGYNDLQRQDEQIKGSWSEVVNQYQRRADLVPNLVNTVKGYAAQEADVLKSVTEARANVGAIKATPELVNDPAAFAKFQAAQSQLTSALSRLLVVAENYPNLKSDALFRDLQSQLVPRALANEYAPPHIPRSRAEGPRKRFFVEDTCYASLPH